MFLHPALAELLVADRQRTLRDEARRATPRPGSLPGLRYLRLRGGHRGRSTVSRCPRVVDPARTG